jgi:acetyl esterase/lipase
MFTLDYPGFSMKKTACLSACLILLFLSCPVTSESSEATVKSHVSYSSVTGLGFNTADKKLVYGDASPDLQYGLLWLPKNLAATQSVPLIVLIHGGCWLNEYDIQHSFPLASALAEAGYAVWSLEYRRTGDPGGAWPGSFDDVRQGIAFTSKLQDYPLDLDRIVVMGHSAGGHLALLAAAEDPGVYGVVGLAAITDIVAYSKGQNNCQAAAIDFMGGSDRANPDAYRAANPAGRPLHDKTLLLQGDMDSIVPFEQSQLAGATTVVFEGAGHFDWIHPGTGAYRLLLSTLEDLFRE